MAYDHDQLYQKCLRAIKDHRLVFIKDIAPMIGIHESTWWDHFPKESEEHKHQLQELETNRISLKVSMRNKWYSSQHQTLQLALYKLLATDEERRRLAQQYIDHTTAGESVTPIDWSKLSDDVIENLYNAINGPDSDPS